MRDMNTTNSTAEVPKTMHAKRSKISAGMSIRVKDGIHLPEMPEVCIANWTGMVMETKGRGAKQQLIIEWDDQTESEMPSSFIEECEQTGLFYKMACLPLDDVHPVD